MESHRPHVASALNVLLFAQAVDDVPACRSVLGSCPPTAGLMGYAWAKPRGATTSAARESVVDSMKRPSLAPFSPPWLRTTTSSTAPRTLHPDSPAPCACGCRHPPLPLWARGCVAACTSDMQPGSASRGWGSRRATVVKTSPSPTSAWSWGDLGPDERLHVRPMTVDHVCEPHHYSPQRAPRVQVLMAIGILLGVTVPRPRTGLPRTDQGLCCPAFSSSTRLPNHALS